MSDKALVMIIGLIFVLAFWLLLFKPSRKAEKQKKAYRAEKEPIPPFLGSEDGLTIDDMVIMDIMDDDF